MLSAVARQKSQRPTTSPSNKKSPLLKPIKEIDNLQKPKGSLSSRLLTNPISKPSTRRKEDHSPLSKDSLNSSRLLQTTSTPRMRVKQEPATKPKKMAKSHQEIVGDLKATSDNVEILEKKDSQQESEDLQKAGSTKCTEKDSETTSYIDEEEKEREDLQRQIGLYGSRREGRARHKNKERMEKMNTLPKEESKVSEEEEIENRRGTFLSTMMLGESPISPIDNKREREENVDRNLETEYEQESYETNEDTIITSNNSENKLSMLINEKIAKKKKRGSQINLEVYIQIENMLRSVKEALLWGQSPYDACNQYIEFAPHKDMECFEQIFKQTSESNLIRSSFLLERLAIPLILYFISDTKSNQKKTQLLKNLASFVHENCMLFGYFVSTKLKDKTRENVWIEKLLDLVEMEESGEATKKENLTRIQRNNGKICETMKGLISTLHNKEIMYGFNSIIVQLDRISIEEAYSRLLKCLSVYMSEKELKTQEVKVKPSPLNTKTVPLPKEKEETIKQTTNKIQETKEKEKINKQKTSKIQEIKKKETKIPIVTKETKVLKKKVIKENKEGKLETEIKDGVEEIQFYLPPLEQYPHDTYTLVLDLDETLVHYIEIPGHYNELRVRPFVEYFLTEVAKYYEVVVFTTGTQEYADWVLDNIDKHKSVSHRLYRHHASMDMSNMSFIKDLSKLGRELSKTLIVDNLPENFRLQPDNGIAIKSWYDDHEDNALLELAPVLVELAKKRVPDIRAALRRFREQMIQNIEDGCENPHLNLTLE